MVSTPNPAEPDRGSPDPLEQGSSEPGPHTYQRLIDLLTEHGVDFELLDHEPVGTTDVSAPSAVIRSRRPRSA